MGLASDASQPKLEDVSNNVESARAYSDVRLSEKEKDELLIDLAEYLLKENFSQFADHTLKEIHDRGNIRYLECVASIQVQKQEYGQSITTYEDIIEMDNTALHCYC